MDRERVSALGKGLLVAILIAQGLGLLLVWGGEGDNPEQPPQSQLPQGRQQRQNDSERTAGGNSPERSAPHDTNDPDRRDAGPARWDQRYVSSGGYSVRYPDGWSLDSSGSVTELTSPDGLTKVSFGETGREDLETSERHLLDTLQREYADVIVTKTSRGRLNRLPARIAEGKATNDSGVRLRFRAVSVSGIAEGFAILSFEKAIGRDQMRAVAVEIMGTFRPTSGGSGTLSMFDPSAGGAG